MKILLIMLFAIAQMKAQGQHESKVIALPVQKATVNGKLKIIGEGDSAVIHFWHNTEDVISWDCNIAEKGDYLVKMNYSLAKELVGGRFSVAVGKHEVISKAIPTNGWLDFETFDLGIIHIDRPGNFSVTVKGVLMPQAKDAALPDVAWMSFVKTGHDADEEIEDGRADKFSGTKIFDGKTLKGWEGNHSCFHVRSNAIVAGSLKEGLSQNEFLATKKEYGDFELKLKVKLVNGKGNGGIQFRSKRVAGSSEMAGYQADMAGGIWGRLYDESRRRDFLCPPLNQDESQKALQQDDWNDYIIRCEGPRIRIWLNNILTVDYTEADPAVPLTGHLGLQIHEGEPSEALYKDIYIKEFNPHKN